MLKNIFILSILLLSLSSFAQMGREGNGGNDIPSQFTSIAKQGYEQLSLMAHQYPWKVRPFNISHIKLLDSKIKEAKVYTVPYKLCKDPADKLCPDEDGFIAKNFSYKVTELDKKTGIEKEKMLIYILINVEKWNKADFKTKTRVSLHEYLGLIGLEKGNYDISSVVDLPADTKVNPKENLVCQISLFKKCPASDPYIYEKEFFFQYCPVGSSTVTLRHFVEGGISGPLFNTAKLKTGLRHKRKTNITYYFRGVGGNSNLRLGVSKDVEWWLSNPNNLRMTNSRYFPYLKDVEKKVVIPDTVFFNDTIIGGNKKIYHGDYSLFVSCTRSGLLSIKGNKK